MITCRRRFRRPRPAARWTTGAGGHLVRPCLGDTRARRAPALPPDDDGRDCEGVLVARILIGLAMIGIAATLAALYWR